MNHSSKVGKCGAQFWPRDGIGFRAKFADSMIAESFVLYMYCVIFSVVGLDCELFLKGCFFVFEFYD